MVCGFGFGVFSHLLVFCWVSGVLWVSLISKLNLLEWNAPGAFNYQLEPWIK